MNPRGCTDRLDEHHPGPTDGDALRAVTASILGVRELATLMDGLPGMAYLCEGNNYSRLQFVSEGCLALTGYRAAELVAGDELAYINLVHREDRDHVISEIAEAARSGRAYRLTYRITTATGHEKWVLDHGHRLPTGAATSDALGGFVIDITEQKEIEDSLHQRTDLLQLQQVISSAANESTTIGHALQAVLDLVCAYTGWPVGHAYVRWPDGDGSLVSAGVWHVAEPERYRRFQECSEAAQGRPGNGLLKQVIEHGKPAWVADLGEHPGFLRAEAAAVAGIRSAFLFPVRLDRETVAVLEFFSDQIGAPNQPLMNALNFLGTQLGRVAERQRAEHALAQRERHFRALLENISDNITIIGADGTVLYESPSVTRLKGFTPEELVGRNCFEMIHPDDLPQVMELFQRGVQIPGHTETLEYRLRHKDGSWRTCEGVGKNLLNDNNVRGIVVSSRDITDRRAAEAALRESERRFRELFEDSPDAIFVEDEQGVVLDANPAACRLHDLPREELVGKNVLDLVPPGDRARVTETFSMWFKTKETLKFEGVSYRRDGRAVPIAIRGRQIEYRGRRALLLHVRDISEQKQAEQALRDAEATYRALVEQSLVGVFLITDSGFAYSNEAGANIFGYTPAEVIGHLGPKDLTAPEDWPQSAEAFRKRLTGEAISAQYQFRGLRKDGSIVHCEVFGRRIEYQGRPAILSTLMDITDRLRAEDQVRQLSQAVEQSPAAIVITDLNGEIEYVNPKFTEVTGYTAAEALGKNPRILKSGETPPESYRELWQIITAGGTWSGEFHNRRKNGSLYWEYAIISPIKDNTGHITHFLAVKEDITERKRISAALMASDLHVRETLDELHRTQQQVIQQDRLGALGRMASGIAHDFNNSLTSILGFSELLLHRPANLENKERARQYLEAINTAAQNASGVVNRLREFYRSRQATDVLTPVNLNQLVDEAIALTQPQWKSQTEVRGVAIDIRTELLPVPDVAGNAADFREAVANLILNAVDAMPRGGALTVRTRPDDAHVLLEIADTGTGMTDEVRNHCFEPFFSTKGDHGTGLGLAVVYGIIQRHDGTIQVQSEPQHGSTFVICLPAAPAGSAPGQPSTVPGAIRPMRVLLVDDELPVRKILTEFLVGDGHTVTAAADGREALEAFRAGRFDLVVLDRAMPGMSGDQLAVTIKSVAPTVPVIMLTGFGALMQAAHERPPAVDFVVAKPVTIVGLREAVARAVCA